MTKFSAIGAAGVVLDIKTGEVLAMTSLPQLNPNAPARAPTTAASTARRSASTSSARPSSRSPSRWRWTRHHQELRPDLQLPARSFTSAATITTPIRSAALLGRRDHEGKLEHRHRPDRGRRSAERQQAFLRKMGFLDPVRSS
jgi:cell division protein FtsI (penicillin-binding protein 3)